MKILRKLSPLFLVACGAPAVVGFGQSVSPRLVIGVPLTRSLQDGSAFVFRAGSESFRARRSQYLVGGGVVAQMPHDLRIDVTVLYQRISYDASAHYSTIGTVPKLVITESSSAADRWQIPLLAYYRLRRPMRSYIGGGVNFSVISRLRGRKEGIEVPPAAFAAPSFFEARPSDALPRRFAVGWTSAAGLEIPARAVRLEPELRYTWWGNLHTDEFSGLEFRRHQFDLLLGIRF